MGPNLVEVVYDRLSVLDSKSGHVLAFNALTMGTAYFMCNAVGPSKLSALTRHVVGAQLGFAVGSALFCLSIWCLFWAADHYRVRGTSAAPVSAEDVLAAESLHPTVVSRTRRYRIALVLAGVGGILSVATAVTLLF